MLEQDSSSPFQFMSLLEVSTFLPKSGSLQRFTTSADHSVEQIRFISQSITFRREDALEPKIPHHRLLRDSAALTGDHANYFKEIMQSIVTLSACSKRDRRNGVFYYISLSDLSMRSLYVVACAFTRPESGPRSSGSYEFQKSDGHK